MKDKIKILIKKSAINANYRENTYSLLECGHNETKINCVCVFSTFNTLLLNRSALYTKGTGVNLRSSAQWVFVGKHCHEIASLPC